MMRDESVQERFEALLGYRNALDGSERELFDLLMGYANEVAIAIDSKTAGIGAHGC